MSKKIFILQKDLPYVKAGAEYISADNFNVGDKCSYVPNKPGMKHTRFAIHEDWMEDKLWFLPVVEEKIEVTHITNWETHDFADKTVYSHGVWLTKPIHVSKYEAVKKAIESAINTEETTLSGKEAYDTGYQKGWKDHEKYNPQTCTDDMLPKAAHPHENAFKDMIFQRNVQNPYSKEGQSHCAYEKGFEECWNYFFKGEMYTEKDVLHIEEAAFIAGRHSYSSGLINFKYRDFSHYKNSQHEI